MPRPFAIVVVVAVAAAAGATGAIAAGALSDDEVEVLPITVGATSGDMVAGEGRLVVEDGIARDRAEELARAAVRRVSGRAVSVESDDGLFEVEVQSRGGAIVEVRLDDRATVVGVEQGEGA